MSDMRERLKRAIYPAIASGNYSDVPFEEAMQRPRYSHLKQALDKYVDAILAELREPTLEMVGKMRRDAQTEYGMASSRHALGGGSTHPYQERILSAAFTAAIDAIKGEGK